ncbi:hypothetical protein [Thermoplasma sp. Kam2015]|uniref:hypothetical protein n=1 Tax=Thermoplasma sp. Kam2015 TaxID=2094122 RepID=UPI001293AC07|nr:hypothetical protein [Thermoplasma sp. Kam2015]
MDYYDLTWGLLKYFIPIVLFIIAIAYNNIILLIIALIWILGSIFVSLMLMEDDKNYSI